MQYTEPEAATPLDLNELEGINFPHVSTREDLDELEQVNVQDGLLWLKNYNKPDLLDEIFLRTLHQKLFGTVWKWAGTYRKTEKNIGIPASQIAIQLRDLLNDTHFWIGNNTYPPIELAIRFHHRLVQIHPFPNGNGRHARIMTDTLLTRTLKEEAIDWRGNELQKVGKRRSDYIAALRSADKGDYHPLFKFIRYSSD